MISDLDFKNLTFRIQEAKTGTLPKSLPEMQSIPSWWDCDRDDKDTAIRYIVLMYDKNSPLVKKYPNLDIRKDSALALAGYNPSDPRLGAYKEFKDDAFADMVIDFLKFQNDYIWMMLCSNEQTFFEFQKTLMLEAAMIRNDKDKISAISAKAKLMEESDNIVNRIMGYRKQIFAEDVIVEKSSKRVAISPEEMAKMS